MFTAMPIDTAPVECEVRPFTAALYADAAKKAKVNLPPNSTYRKCNVPGERSAIVTMPASGGTEACVFYEFPVDPGRPEVQKPKEKMRTGVAKSLAGKECPKLEFGARTYPGRDYFFLSDNVPLVNAHRVKETVEKGGLAFLKSEIAQRKEGAPPDAGQSPLRVAAIDAAKESECRVKASFFQGRYSACYRAEVYNEAVRGGLALHLALNKKGEYVFIQSTYAKP
ncbi:MAG: hypothetical protein V4723_09665 [Pseudomonadota bacterium]